MITLSDILAGKLPPVKRTFDIEDVGELELHRLPLSYETKARELIDANNTDSLAELDDLIIKCVYYMLNGSFSDTESQKLADVMDRVTMSKVFATGLYFKDVSPANKEALEKN